MAWTLTFNNQVIGDVLLKSEPANVMLTPPARGTGLFQDTSRINADSRNMVYARRFFIKVKLADNFALDQAIAAVQALQGLRGNIEAKDGVTLKILCESWVIDYVNAPNLLPAFGGRFTDQLVITAIGETPPQYF